MHYAARLGFGDIVKLLITSGADINLRDANGFNAAHWAKMNEFYDIVEEIGPPRSIAPNDYQEYKNAMIQIHQINLKKKKKKGKKKKWDNIKKWDNECVMIDYMDWSCTLNSIRKFTINLKYSYDGF